MASRSLSRIHQPSCPSLRPLVLPLLCPPLPTSSPVDSDPQSACSQRHIYPKLCPSRVGVRLKQLIVQSTRRVGTVISQRILEGRSICAVIRVPIVLCPLMTTRRGDRRILKPARVRERISSDPSIRSSFYSGWCTSLSEVFSLFIWSTTTSSLSSSRCTRRIRPVQPRVGLNRSSSRLQTCFIFFNPL